MKHNASHPFSHILSSFVHSNNMQGTKNTIEFVKIAYISNVDIYYELKFFDSFISLYEFRMPILLFLTLSEI